MTVIVGSVLLIALIVVTILLRGPAIETDIENRSELAVAIQSVAIGEVRAEADGRDVTLYGTVREEQVDYITAFIDDLWGVGTVTLADDIQVIAATTTTEAPTTTTSPVTVPPTTTAPPTTVPVTTVPNLPASSLTIDDNTITALVPTPVDVRRIAMAGRVAGFETDLAAGEVADAPWLDGIDGAIIALRTVARPMLAIDGATATLGGEVADDATRTQVLDRFAGLGLDIEASALVIAEAPDAATASELEETLNEMLADSSVLFDTASTAISPAGAALLSEIATLVRQIPGARIEVQGHTDNEGDDDGNLVLSQARADAVVSYLVDAGVAPVQVTAVGYGESQPIASNTTEEGRAANRRIEFSVEGAA